MNKIKITVFINKTQDDELKLLSQTLEISQGLIVRQALTDYFKKIKESEELK